MGFGEEYQAYYAQVYRLCLRYLRQAQDAEDAAQEVFVRMWQHWRVFFQWQEEHRRAWLLHVAANLCRDELRRRCKREVPLAESAAVWPQEELQMETQMLPEPYRTVLQLYYFGGYRTGEIALLLGRSSATVRTQLVRGRRRLRRMMEETI